MLKLKTSRMIHNPFTPTLPYRGQWDDIDSLEDVWNMVLPGLQKMLSSLQSPPGRRLVVEDKVIMLDDENYRELEFAHHIISNHSLMVLNFLKSPLSSVTQTQLEEVIRAVVILLKESEKNVNILQYSLGGKRWQSVYSYTSLLLSLLITFSVIQESTANHYRSPPLEFVDQRSSPSSWAIQDAIYYLDFALIKTNGWPIDKHIHGFLGFIEYGVLRILGDRHENVTPTTLSIVKEIPPTVELKFPGKVLLEPSVKDWLEVYQQQEPSKLENILWHWPVFDDPQDEGDVEYTVVEGKPYRSTRRFSKWALKPYLLSKTIKGRRIVPVEIGRNYVDPDLKQKIITFKTYIEQYLIKEPGDDDVGYLAQHNLLTQIPGFRDDISIPDFINYSNLAKLHSYDNDDEDSDEEEVNVTINAWLGPAGTITPLHTDNYQNIFCQVVGTKYIRLYPPSATPAMFPMGKDERGVNMSNTSSIPAEWVEGNVDLRVGLENEEEYRWNTFKKEKYVEFVVHEGDAVFFPRGWWHYVRSLETSFSVNFWWTDNYEFVRA